MRLDRAHAAVRGAAIYSDMGFERERRESLARWPEALAELRRTVSDNSGQQVQLDRVGAAAEAYLRWSRGMEQRMADGEWDAVRAELLTAHGEDLLARVQSALNGERLALARAFRDAAGKRVCLVATTGWGQDGDREFWATAASTWRSRAVPATA